jgi:hypothetical protein
MNGFTVNPKTADVTLQGDLTTLRNLRKQDVRVLVDLSDRGALRDSRRRIDVSTPAGVTHIKVEPEEVQVVTAPKN